MSSVYTTVTHPDGYKGLPWYEIRGNQIYTTRLKSIRNEVDLAQLAQLEETRYLLRFWEEQSRYFDFNLVDDDLRMIRIGDAPHDTVMEFVGIDRKEVSKLMQFPTTKRELIDRLQVRAVVFGDRTEVNALFPIRPISSHKCSSI